MVGEGWFKLQGDFGEGFAVGGDGTEGGHVGVVDGGVVVLGEGAGQLGVAVEDHYRAFHQRDGGEYGTEVLVEAFLHFVMWVEACVEDQGAVEGHAADRIGAPAGGGDGAFPEAVGDPSCHLLVGVHDEIGHPFVADLTQEAEIFYEEEAHLGIVGRPAVGNLRVVDYGADHAGALTLDLQRLNDSRLPGAERLFVELPEMEEVIGAFSHRG